MGKDDSTIGKGLSARPGRYEKKPQEAHKVDAQLLTPDNRESVAAWCGGQVKQGYFVESISFPTIEGNILAEVGEYVVKDLETGQFFAMSSETFEQTYQSTKVYREAVKGPDGIRGADGIQGATADRGADGIQMPFNAAKVRADLEKNIATRSLFGKPNSRF